MMNYHLVILSRGYKQTDRVESGGREAKNKEGAENEEKEKDIYLRESDAVLLFDIQATERESFQKNGKREEHQRWIV